MDKTEGQPRVSAIIPVHNASATLQRCLSALADSDYSHLQIIVVDDGSTDASLKVARKYASRILKLECGPYGPAYARNYGAQVADGDILFFVDADVVIRPDTVSKVASTFIQHPEYDATFGSYDEEPGDGEFLSQFKNLFHHFVHQQAREEGGTFWSGCGAIRRDVFLKAGGFDVDRYPSPSIEDIELGCRLRAAGHKIFVNKEIQVTHLKRWTLPGLLKTDVVDRGIPWTLLIMQERNLPDDLNLNLSQRLSAMLLALTLVYLVSNSLFNNIILLPLLVILFLLLVSNWHLYDGPTFFGLSRKAEVLSLVLMGVIALLAILGDLSLLLPPLILLSAVMLAGHLLPHIGLYVKHLLFGILIFALIVGIAVVFVSFPVRIVLPICFALALIVTLNRRLYLFFVRKRGVVFALAAFPFHLLYYIYSMFAFVIGGGIHLWNTGIRSIVRI